uniref:AT1G31600 protein n=1 Tax=Arabidopsis thaliana TaxID=3702 RepID=C0Z2R4_ARATH|nr:AT1G31600 [Arabidopsis thaliana]
MVQPRFVRPTQSSPSSISGEPNSSNLYVANCGPAVGLTHNAIAAVFAEFGEVNGVYAADDSGVRVIVSFADPFSAKAALEALSGRPCPDLKGRSLHIRYSVLQLPSEVLPINGSYHITIRFLYGSQSFDLYVMLDLYVAKF